MFIGFQRTASETLFKKGTDSTQGSVAVTLGYSNYEDERQSLYPVRTGHISQGAHSHQAD